MASNRAPDNVRNETDTAMTGTTTPNQPGPTTQPPADNVSDAPPSHTSLDTNHYDDMTDQNDDDEEGEDTWVKSALETLDGKLNKRWSTVTKKLSQQEKQTQQVLAELASIKHLHRQEARRTREAYETTHEVVKSIAQKQDVLLETINNNGSSVEGLQDKLVNSLEAKLKSTLNSFRNQHPTPTEARGYSKASEQPAVTQQQKDVEPVGKYTTMARRAQNTNRTATVANGNLARLYVRDWRSEPVGRVKKALRQEIADWARRENMEGVAESDKQADSDVDAVRHVNQFGTPTVPVMEIACVPEKLDLVQSFFQANDIRIWENINPFQEQSLDASDNSQEAKRYRKAHFTGLLLAWWKAANFVQSRDTARYYHLLINAAVRSPTELHAWPNDIICVKIDAHGISDSKGNPAIDFDYEEGFDPPPETSTRNSTLQVRFLATGGTPAAPPAQKRMRQTQTTPTPKQVHRKPCPSRTKYSPPLEHRSTNLLHPNSKAHPQPYPRQHWRRHAGRGGVLPSVPNHPAAN